MKANWRYGQSDAPNLLRHFDYLIVRKNGKRDWFFIFNGFFLILFAFLSGNWSLSILLVFCFFWIAPWIVRIRQFGFRRGTKYFWKELKKFDTEKWLLPKIHNKKSRLLKLIHTSFFARWFRTWPIFFRELFWSLILIIVGIWAFNLYSEFPSNDQQIKVLIHELGKYIPLPNVNEEAIFMGGIFVGLGTLRIILFAGNWLLNKLNVPINIRIEFYS